MGRRKKEQGRAKKRIRLDKEELVEQSASQVETQHVTKKSDKELFELDHTADLKVAVEQESIERQRKKKRQKGLNHVDQGKVNKLVEEHSALELKKIVRKNKNQIRDGMRKRRTLGSVKPKFDLWNTDKEEKVPVKPNPQEKQPIGSCLAGTAPSFPEFKNKKAMGLQKKYKTLAIEVAEAGQSYRPDKEQHQNIIGEALAMELRRNEVEEYDAKPFRMSKHTKSLLLGSDDEGDESDDDNMSVDGDNTLVRLKPKEKLTIAMRNKQKRHQALLYEIRERKKEKQFVHSLTGVNKIKKELREKEKLSKDRKEIITKLKVDSQRTLGKGLWAELSSSDPRQAPTLPVGLTKEIASGTLRTVIPKGSLLTDRLESLRDRKMTDPKKKTERKRIVQGKSRIKVRGEGRRKGPKQAFKEDGSDFLLMA
eukprot:CAMPEP_0194159180 /NCGR_PEP_ID=MMETSP0152-20130528/77685_1 /TAXON_ID=1049557 /ORGANISM="Thalassiothrix antarctica, Strain L6-D1" /LENGTH=423 /DNA_ID=CAMNT_0038868715 /DNA_START=635 /DNA_END=1906 /DNA_ORIENTATION=-